MHISEQELNLLRTRIAELEAQNELLENKVQSLLEDISCSEVTIDELNDEIEALMAEMDDHF